MMVGIDRAHRVVVLGGSGWLGRHVCDRFADRGYQVLAVGRHPARHLSRHRFRRLDVAAASPEELTELLVSAGAAVVVNATDGANARDGWQRTEAELQHANVDSVHRLLAALAVLPGRPRLVHIGTIHEYGPPVRDAPMTELAEPRPTTPYARTKLAGSQAVLAAARRGRVDAVVLRLTNLCGPYPSPASFPGKLLGILRAAARQDHPGQAPVQVAAAHRDFLDVRDAARAVLAAAGSPVTGTVCNLGSGRAAPITELVDALVAASGLPPQALDRRAVPGPAERLEVDIRRAARVLDWRPSIGLPESMAAMWAAA